MAAPEETTKAPEDFEAYLRVAKYPLVKYTGELCVGSYCTCRKIPLHAFQSLGFYLIGRPVDHARVTSRLALAPVPTGSWGTYHHPSAGDLNP